MKSPRFYKIKRLEKALDNVTYKLTNYTFKSNIEILKLFTTFCEIEKELEIQQAYVNHE